MVLDAGHGGTEEGAKGLFVLLLLWFRRRVIDGVLDGSVYAGIVGVGSAGPWGTTGARLTAWRRFSASRPRWRASLR